MANWQSIMTVIWIISTKQSVGIQLKQAIFFYWFSISDCPVSDTYLFDDSLNPSIEHFDKPANQWWKMRCYRCIFRSTDSTDSKTNSVSITEFYGHVHVFSILRCTAQKENHTTAKVRICLYRKTPTRSAPAILTEQWDPPGLFDVVS